MKRLYDVGWFFKQINGELERRANNSLRSHELTMSQITTLLILRENPNKQATLKEIERELHVAQSTTVGIISRLEQKGFVRCFSDSNDKRVKIAELTDLGETYCLEAEKEMESAEKLILTGLDEQEKQQLVKLLTKVWGNLK